MVLGLVFTPRITYKTAHFIPRSSGLIGLSYYLFTDNNLTNNLAVEKEFDYIFIKCGCLFRKSILYEQLFKVCCFDIILCIKFFVCVFRCWGYSNFASFTLPFVCFIFQVILSSKLTWFSRSQRLNLK